MAIKGRSRIRVVRRHADERIDQGLEVEITISSPHPLSGDEFRATVPLIDAADDLVELARKNATLRLPEDG